MDMMTLIMKIFHLMNYSTIAPNLFEPGKIRPWIEFIVQILDAQQGADSELSKWTDDKDQIQKLDKDSWWQLKGVCAKNSLKLYQKYLVDNMSTRP